MRKIDGEFRARESENSFPKIVLLFSFSLSVDNRRQRRKGKGKGGIRIESNRSLFIQMTEADVECHFLPPTLSHSVCVLPSLLSVFFFYLFSIF